MASTKESAADRLADIIRALRPGHQYNLQDMATKVGVKASTVERILQRYNSLLGRAERQYRIPISSAKGTFTLPDVVRIGDLRAYRPSREATGVQGQGGVGFKYSRHSGTGDRR